MTYGYRVIIEPLKDEDGGGYVVSVPDLPGCMSDGETYEEAGHNVEDAIACWLEAAGELGRDAPVPSHENRRDA
ncbi:type II toxin-antitoxin system HicB family antitoxin [Agrobacterium sp. rho-13.3]|uniref:type II toxin-antitoxin system HicB family antitoxin n=1 Tax=Agrobacterium sp. rho-13.3 TaxID=3072980 RepID=UPI002A15F248|nr:type II toxin-antitoxin system HicB family antitoxin [Agrobacterium sp. rho-13.3]MDX8312073.1 type II toxin-antitoxin system HicB family antitoxin [Agrobacterium sp. rho-13.3]